MASLPAPNIDAADSSGPSIDVSSASEAPVSANVLASLWTQALENYKNKTGMDPLTHPLTKDLANRKSVDEIMSLFDAKMREFKSFRTGDPKWAKLRNDYLKPAVKVVLSLNDALAEAAAYFPVVPGGKGIFVAFGVLLTATEGMTKRYDALIDLFEEIPFFLDSVRVRESNPQSWGIASQKIAIAILVHLLDVFALALKLMKAVFSANPLQRVAHFGQSLFGNADMQDALRRLRRLTNLEIRAMVSELRVDTAENREIAKSLLGDLAAMDLAYSNHFIDITTHLQRESELASEERTQAEDERHRAEAARTRHQQELEQIRHTQAEGAADAALDRLDRLDIADLTAQDRPGCLAGTRVAILAGLSAWSHEPDAPRTYWLNGMAGTGKSAIARSFGRQLRADGLLGGSFFCSRESDAELKETKRIMPTLAAALAARDLNYRAALLRVLANYSSEPRPSTWGLSEQVERLFCEPFSPIERTSSPCYVLLIDALDETSDETVGQLLHILVSRSWKIPIKFFLTSRPEEHIRRGLSLIGTALRLHDIEKDLVAADIYLYVSHRMQAVTAEFWDHELPADWPAPDDVHSLASLAGVLFIHAFTSTEYIRVGNPVKRLRDVLNIGYQSGYQMNPLNHLDEIYKFILSSIDGTEDELCLTRRIVTAILTLCHPLTIGALSKLLYVEVYELKSALRHLHAVIYVPEKVDSGTLTTFHASFGDFLTSSYRAPSNMLIHEAHGHHDLLSQSIAIMSSSDLHFNMSQAKTSYLLNPKQILAVIPEHVAYACEHWIQHFIAWDEYTQDHQVVIDQKIVLHQLEWVLSYKTFFWLEACAVIRCVWDWREDWNKMLGASAFAHGSSDLMLLLQEIGSILSEIMSVTEIASPHVYLSIIPFLESSSLLATRITGLFSHVISYDLVYTPFTPLKNESFSAIIFSADGGYIIAASDKTHNIYMWHTDTSMLFQVLKAHSDRVTALASSTSHALLASASYDKTICLWNVMSGQLISHFDYSIQLDCISALIFLPDNRLALVGVSDFDVAYIYICSELLSRPKSHLYLSVPGMRTIRISNDGSHAVVGNYDDDLQVWSLEENQFSLRFCLQDSSDHQCVCLSPEGAHMLSILQYKAYLWDLTSGLIIHERHWDSSDSISASISSTHVAISPWPGIELFDRASNNYRIYLSADAKDIVGMAFSQDGSHLVSSYKDGGICVWDIYSMSDQCKAVMTGTFSHFYLPSRSEEIVEPVGGIEVVSDCICGPNGELVLYIPAEYQEYLQHPPCQTRIAECRLTINWEGAVHGEDWTKCYIGPEFITPETYPIQL